MRAIILAAGRGSRMGSATAEQPKCLTRLCGKPLLAWQLEALRGAGIGRIAVVRGYMKETLAFPGVETFDNPRWAETNMVASLACAGAWLHEDECVVSYSDIVYPSSTITKLARMQGDIAITYYTAWRGLWEERFKDPLSDAESFRVDAAGRLLDIGARPRTLDEIQGQYMGLLRFTPAGWRSVQTVIGNLEPRSRDKLDMTSMLQRMLSTGTPILAMPVSDPWYEVDSQSDLELYEDRARRRGGFLF